MAEKTEIVYGVHAIMHLINLSCENAPEIWLQENKRNSKELSELYSLIHAGGLKIQYAAKAKLDKLTANSVHQGVVVRRRLTRSKKTDISFLLKVSKEKLPLLLILDGIQDPHNLGACLRTANATGVNAIIIPKDRAVSVNSTVKKVASGAAEYTPVVTVTNLARTMRTLRQEGIWVFGATDDASSNLYEQDLSVPMAIVLGAEGKGLKQNTRKHCDKLFSIPMKGNVESLNISVAASICLYEAIRQRSHSVT